MTNKNLIFANFVWSNCAIFTKIMCFCRLLDRLVSKVRKLEDVYATIKHVGARHAEGGYSVTPQHMKVKNRFLI